MTHPLQPNTVWRLLENATTPTAQQQARAAIARLADINAPGPTGVSLLMRAARTHRVFAVEALLAAGADPNATDAVVGSVGQAYPVLSYVFVDWESRSDLAHARPVLRRLLEAGADPRRPGLWNQVCDRGATAAQAFLGEMPDLPEPSDPWLAPLHHAWLDAPTTDPARWRPVFEVLRSRGADPLQRIDGQDVWARTMASTVLAARVQPPSQGETEARAALRSVWNEQVLAAELDRDLQGPTASKRPRL